MESSVQKIRSWRTGVAMDFDISSYGATPGQRRVIVAKIWGQYKVPGTRREGHHFLSMVIAAAAAWTGPQELRLVLDVSELKYSGGDRFLSWRTVPRRCGYPDSTSRIALVWSEENRRHIASLIEQFEDQQLASACFDDFDAALHWAANAQ